MPESRRVSANALSFWSLYDSLQRQSCLLSTCGSTLIGRLVMEMERYNLQSICSSRPLSMSSPLNNVDAETSMGYRGGVFIKVPAPVPELSPQFKRSPPGPPDPGHPSSIPNLQGERQDSIPRCTIRRAQAQFLALAERGRRGTVTVLQWHVPMMNSVIDACESWLRPGLTSGGGESTLRG